MVAGYQLHFALLLLVGNFFRLVLAGTILVRHCYFGLVKGFQCNQSRCGYGITKIDIGDVCIGRLHVGV